MKKDGLAVEGKGDLVQGRPVSSIIVVPSQTQKRWGWGSTDLFGVVISTQQTSKQTLRGFFP